MHTCFQTSSDLLDQSDGLLDNSSEVILVKKEIQT